MGRRRGLLLVEVLDLVGFSTDVDVTSQALGNVDILSSCGKCQNNSDGIGIGTLNEVVLIHMTGRAIHFPVRKLVKQCLTLTSS